MPARSIDTGNLQPVKVEASDTIMAGEHMSESYGATS